MGGGATAPTRALANRAGCPQPARGAGAGVPLPRRTLANLHEARYHRPRRYIPGPAAAGRAVSDLQGGNPMVDHSVMPSALQVAQAVSAVLGKKLADHGASEIVLTREEAALCLGLAEGVAENLGQGEPDAG